MIRIGLWRHCISHQNQSQEPTGVVLVFSLMRRRVSELKQLRLFEHSDARRLNGVLVVVKAPSLVMIPKPNMASKLLKMQVC